MTFWAILEQVLAYLPFFQGLSPIIPTVIEDLAALDTLTAANSSATFAAFSFYEKGHKFTVGPIPVVRNS